MHGARYANASWNLLVTDVATGKTVYELNPDRLAFTGSVRKLLSVGLALNALGAGHRFVTPVYRQGSVHAGTLNGDLILVGRGDLVLGGRAERDDRIAYTNFDHNDANNLGTALLTPQDSLCGLDALARQVLASGITAVRGDVLVDDRLFETYRVPNGNLLITPILPPAYKAPLSASPTLIRTFRVESPASFARIAFVQALSRAGVRVSAPLRANSDAGKLPPRGTYTRDARVAALVPAPFSEYAKLVLKVSLNLGANLSLSLFGLTQGERTIGGALAAERKMLVTTTKIPANEFAFPTNGSGSPDSRAAPRATVQMLVAMSNGVNASVYRNALPILGVDGSLAETGVALAAKGYIEAKSGRHLVRPQRFVGACRHA